MVEYKPYLDELFVGADSLMWSLSSSEGQFTNYEFVRRTVRVTRALMPVSWPS